VDKVEAHITANNLTPPLYFGLNCTYPKNVDKAMTEKLRGKILYVRGNPSKLSLEERDKLTELDEGDID